MNPEVTPVLYHQVFKELRACPVCDACLAARSLNHLGILGILMVTVRVGMAIRISCSAVDLFGVHIRIICGTCFGVRSG
jgi:hypothetical protein